MRRAVLITGASTGIGAIHADRFGRRGHDLVLVARNVDRMTTLVYGATKAFVLFLSQGLSLELAPKGVHVQAVLPAATRTEIWEHAGVEIRTTRGVMEAGELVDAAFVGFDRREPVTLPPLPDASQWSAFDTSRQAMLPNFAQALAAERYRFAA